MRWMIDHVMSRRGGLVVFVFVLSVLSFSFPDSYFNDRGGQRVNNTRCSHGVSDKK